MNSGAVSHSLYLVASEGESAISVMDGILWRRLNVVRNRMATLVRIRRKDSLSRAIQYLYNCLPADARARVLLSSEFCEYTTLCYPKDDPASFEDFRHAEEALLAAGLLDVLYRERSLVEISNGNLDYYARRCKEGVFFSPMGNRKAVRDSSGNWKVVDLPNIGGVISIDFDSQIARSHELRSGVLSQPRVELTEEERIKVVSKLQVALEQIDETCPTYGFLIKIFVRRIIVRKSADVPTQSSGAVAVAVGSEHVPRQPGSFRMLNTHLPEVTSDSCMETILHESMHNFLAAWETVNQPFTVNDDNYRPVSPWSGNCIPNSSYIHACFIYFVCYRLYKSYLGDCRTRTSSQKDFIIGKLKKFMAGFLIPQSVCDQLVLEKPLPEEIRVVLERLQNEMRAETAKLAAI